MNPSSEDIKDILEAESSLGLVFGENLFIGREPSSPNNTITIFDTPGKPPQQTYKKGENYYYPSIQIRARNDDYISGITLLSSIRDVLHNMNNETINSTLYCSIVAKGEPALLDWDQNARPRFILNFDIQRR